MLLLLEIIAVLVLLGFATAEVFWPIGILAVFALIGAWWFSHLAMLLAFLNPFWIAAYFVIGIAWVFFKWTRAVESKLREFKRFRKTYPDYKCDPPRWTEYWDDFTGHFFWWPFSMAAYVLKDVLINVWEWLSRLITKSFDRYAEWRFRSLEGGQS